MKLPAFTAEASLRQPTRWYVSPSTAVPDTQTIQPAFLTAIHRFPVTHLGPGAACDLCIADCVRRGELQSSCRNLCSFLCD